MSEALQPLQKAVRLFGSEEKLSRAAGFSQNAINQAKKRGRISAELAVGIERATNGEIPRWQIRPDLWDAPSDAGRAA